MNFPGRRIRDAGADQVISDTDKSEATRFRDVAAVAPAHLSVGLNDEHVDDFHIPLQACAKEETA
jgi:hypothetical protein